MKKIKAKKTAFRYMQYLLLVTLSQLLRIAPHALLAIAAEVLGAAGFLVLSRARRLGIANTMKVLPEADPATVRRTVRRAFANAALVFLEIPFYYYRDGNLEQVPIHGLEHLKAALANGKGAICITGHISNWDVLGKVMALNGIPPAGVARRLHNLYIDAWITRVRTAYGCKVIYKSSSVSWNKQIIRALRAGGAMFLVMDQYISGGLKAAFFGWKTPSPTGPYRMAKATDAPVHLVYMLRIKGRYEVFVSPEIPLVEKENRDDETLANTEEFNRRIEDVIRAHPDQWLCFHKRFRKCEPVTGQGQ